MPDGLRHSAARARPQIETWNGPARHNDALRRKDRRD